METKDDNLSSKELAEKQHREKLEILQQAKESRGQQLEVDFVTGELSEVNEIKELINNNIQDPAEKFDLYYNGIRAVLMKYLPKENFEEQKRIIYDEKNVFLNRGKKKDKYGRRGSDGRMTYNEDMKELVEVIALWVMESQDPTDLYQRLYNLNEKYNYGHQLMP